MCCGNKRVQMRASIHDGHAVDRFVPAATRSKGFVLFVNLGNKDLSVVGPVSGRTYHFGSAGSKVQVDVRDQPMLARLHQLRVVR